MQANLVPDAMYLKNMRLLQVTFRSADPVRALSTQAAKLNAVNLPF
jgi:hypothetical protein